MAINGGSGIGILAAVIGGALALDTIGKKQTTIGRLTTDGFTKDAAIRTLRSQVSNEQSLRTHAEGTVRQRDSIIRTLELVRDQIAAERNTARDQLADTAKRFAAKELETVNAIAERDALRRAKADLEAEVARLKAAAAAASSTPPAAPSA